VADAAERWSDADFPPRVRATAALEAGLGYTIPVIDYALDRLFAGLTVPVMRMAIEAEVGDRAALDGFTARAGGRAAWARGVDRVTIVSSDASIGAAIPPLGYALCAKCRVTLLNGDTFVAAFAETLGEALPETRAAIDLRAWAGVGDASFGAAGTIVAFGGIDALRTIRAACAPDATFVGLRPGVSAGYVDRAALTGDLRALAAAIARDALLYGGGGAHALRYLFVERLDAATQQRLVEALADARAAALIEFPPGRHDPPAELQPIVVDGPDAAAEYVAQYAIPVQAVGVTPTLDDAAATALAEAFGAVRIAPFGQLQAPPGGGHDGGRARIADFIRWIDRA
jgi:hypothetical protein